MQRKKKSFFLPVSTYQNENIMQYDDIYFSNFSYSVISMCISSLFDELCTSDSVKCSFHWDKKYTFHSLQGNRIKRKQNPTRTWTHAHDILYHWNMKKELQGTNITQISISCRIALLVVNFPTFQLIHCTIFIFSLT